MKNFFKKVFVFFSLMFLLLVISVLAIVYSPVFLLNSLVLFAFKVLFKPVPWLKDCAKEVFKKKPEVGG